MESKFKVGDRVKWTKYGGSSWQNCTITHISPSFDGLMGYMLTDPHPEFGDGWIAEDELELVAPTPESKAISLLRKIVYRGGYGEIGVEAMAILAELYPVDPDLIEARNCVAKVYEGAGRHDLAEATRNGKQDNRLRVQSALAAIKRGRELERGE